MTACFVGGWVAFVLARRLLVAARSSPPSWPSCSPRSPWSPTTWPTGRSSAPDAPAEVAGLLAGNLGIGMSYGWWMDKHTRHHANPNHEDHDPDVDAGHPGLVARPGRAPAAALPRFIGRWQAFLFFPLLTLEGLNLHVVQRPRARRDPACAPPRLEARLLVAALRRRTWPRCSLVLPPGMASAFFAVHQALFGVYLGSIFAPNHKGMPMLTGGDAARLPAQAGAHLAQRPRWLRRGRRPRRAQLPDRAPPLPEHADRRTCAGRSRSCRRYCAELGIPYLRRAS